MATVQEALEARKKRKEEYEAQKYDVSTAFETYKRRKQSSSKSAISDIATRINDEVKAIKYAPSLSWGVGSYEKASKSTSERRSNVKNLTREIESYKAYWDEETYNSLSSAVKQLQDGYDSYLGSAKIRENFDSEDSYNLWYKREKEKQDVLGAADFDQYTQVGANVNNPSYKDTQAPLDIFGWKPFGDGEDVNNIVTFAEANSSEVFKEAVRGNGHLSDEANLVYLINEFMTDEEKSIYNYYIGKGDKKKADEYMEYVTDLLKQRQAGKMVEQADGKALELVFSAVAGLDQFASGIKNIDNYLMGKEAEPTTAVQYAQSEMSSNNEGAWKVANDVVSTTSNMLPSILVGTVTGGVGGIATMTGSAIGNSYAEMRNLGYEDWQAAGYATLVGASEALLQSALGGISKLGGKYSLSAATTKLVSGIDNAFARLAIQVPLNMGSEAVEEMIQTALEPAFKALMTGEEYEAAEWSEIIYSGLLGALSAGMVEGIPGTIGAIKESHNASITKSIYGDNIQDLLVESAEIGGNNAKTDNLINKYGKNGDLSKWEIQSLINSNEEALVSQDKEKIRSAVKERLALYGETENIDKIADVITKIAAGEDITRSERNILTNSKYGRRVSTELNPDVIEAGTHTTEWAENLDTERINVEAYDKGTKYVKGSAKGIIQKSLDGLEDPDDEEKEIEGKYKVSESGNTIYKDSDVNIESVVSVKGDDIKVKLDNGETVSAKELSFSAAEEAAMYNMIARMEVSAETANDLLSTFKPTNSSESLQYLTSVPLAYKFGKINYEAGLEHIKLSEELKRTVYNRGRIDATLETKTNPSATSKGKSQKGTSTKKNGIIFEKGVTYNEGTANDLQKASMAAIEAINAISNLEVHVFESKVENGERVYYLNGKREVAPNGFFRDGNKIYIDLNAGNKGEGAMLYTMAHEVTHYIRKWNAKGFKELADFLIEQYGKKGVPVNALIEAQKAKIKQRYKREGKTLPGEAKLYDMAYEEMVADAMSDMLADEKAYEKLAKLKQQNKSLWKKLGEAIKHILDKLKAVIGLYSKDKAPVAQEAYFVREFAPDVYDKLQDLYLKAFVEADNNYSSAEETLAENGIVVNPDTESASLLSVRDVLGEDQRQKVAAALATRFGVTKKEAMDWLKAETSMASLILNPKYSQYLDYNPDPNEVAIKQNSDYPQGTVDFSPICAKRREFTSVMNNILRLFPNHVFAATDLAKIRSIMQEEGMTIPCGICYVEDRRQLDTIVAQNFIDSLKLYREGSKTRPDGKAFNANQLKGLSLTDGDTYTPSVYELVSLEGLNVLKEKNPNMAEAWVKFNNARGMQSVRLLANEAEYKRQILKYDKRTVKSKNDKGGLRVYSFSDAEMFHLIDIIQVITDSATVGLSLQGYTKVNEYARAVKDTGEKLNRSLIPKGELGYHIENGKVVLDYDTVEGIDINHPDFFDNRDNPNVGNITIGVSDVQIRAAMVSDFVDQIIPFHTGQSEEVLGEKGISTWSNYKDFQTEKDIATGKVSDHQINIYTEVLQVLEKEGKPITKRTFVEKFLQVCKDNGLTPRFSQFLNTNENGEYVYTEGYHKMLVDFKTFAQTEAGEYLPQMPVKPIFDNEYITGIMKDYVKSQKVKDAELAKSMPKVIERITNEIVKPSETQFSDRDSSYMDAVKRGDMETAQKLVDEAAITAGAMRLKEGVAKPYYHGTSAKFTSFDAEKARDGTYGYGFYFSPMRSKAGEYGELMNVYLMTDRIATRNSHSITVDQVNSFIKKYDLDLNSTVLKFADSVEEWMDYKNNDMSILLDLENFVVRNMDFNTERLLKDMIEIFDYDGIRQTNETVLWDNRLIKSANPVTYDDNGNVIPLSERFNTENDDIRYSDRGGNVKSASELSEQDLKYLLEGVQNGVYSNSSYIPLRRNTPEFFIGVVKEHSKGMYFIEDYPMASTVEHLRQNMEEDDGESYGNHRPHGLSIEDIITISREMGNPSYIVLQKNGRYAEVVSFFNKRNKKVVVAIDVADSRSISSNNYKYSQYMNGYNEGYYNIIVTQFEPDSLEAYLENNTVVYDKAKMNGRYQVGSGRIVTVTHDTPFIEDIIPQEPNSVNSEFSEDEKVYSDRDSYATTFYSHMGKVIDDIKLEKMGANGVVSYLKGKGVKDEEIKWSGIETFLEGKKSVTKAELQEFVAGSQLQIEEQERSNTFQYTTEQIELLDKLGEENAKTWDKIAQKWENLFGEPMPIVDIVASPYPESAMARALREKAASIEEKRALFELVSSIIGNQEEMKRIADEARAATPKAKWDDYKLDGGSNYRELVFKMPNSTYSNRAMRGHWGQDAEGILVHTRVQDFNVNGKKMLFIEELQSDWHNEGLEKGYTTPEYEDAVAVYDKLADEYGKVRQAFNKYVRSSEFRSDPDEVSKKKFDWLRSKMDIAEKRMQDAERDVEKLKEKGMGDVADAPFKKNYHEYVLKRLLRMAAEEGYDSIGWTIADTQSKRWSYDYEKAYQIEYDQEMPKFLRKYGKKWGATVGKSSIGNTEVWSMDITDSMKDSVLREGQPLYQDRDTNAISNRTLLANALESTVQNDIEKNKLDQYKKKIALIESEQAKLDKNRSEAETLRFKKGRVPSETKRLRDLDAEATQLKNRITTYDKQLLNLEATTALKNVLAREKEMVRKRTEQKGREALASYKEKAAKTQKELLTRWQESRHKAVEGRNKTAMKHKIKNVVSDLNKLLLNPTKEQHVPIGLQKVVAEALDAINMDTMNAEERVTYYNDLIAKSSDPDEIAMLTKKRDFFEYRDANFKDKITALKNAYAEFKESEDPLVKNAHNEAIENLIKNVADEVGNKSLKDMSLSQLEAVYDMYKAVLATVRNSNKLFKEGKKESISETSESVKTEVKEVGGHKDRINKLMKTFKKFGWNMLKPVTAMKVIGSNTFEDLFANVRAGEDTWAVDVNEAKEFYEDKADKYKYNKWDFKKRYTFKDSAGNDFSLSLEQIMSLYAYSKREQADQHLEVGGFVFDDSIEVVEKNKLGIPMKYEVNDANPYRLRKEDLATVISSLTIEQKCFVDEMQTYLSEVMGAKGNEVSLAMYDIKLYKEVNYFPLKTSRYFREFDPEKSATPKIRNAGFSKKTIPNAGNPIVLSNFMDVWANHVNDMSMYHAFVLPLEDFMRVYNYSSTAGGYDSVQQYIKNAYGAEANLYIEKLMDDLNGGARVDSTAGIINKGLALFKKSAVFASASVVIQQPSAIARAFAYINPKYFAKSVPSAMNLVKHKELWKEVKKYAPVAVIKEMGYFDTGMGRSTVEWIKGNHTIRAKVDDVLSKAPAIADELTWTHIWQAVKSEIKATTNLKVGSEEYLKRCGERFTEVVINTQVYDSVLARSGMMRSKDTGMKMATAFMAEPTTTANMLIDGIIQGKRGKLKFLGATVGAVSSAIILNSILVSLVYASRDDDEDETFAEKYITSLTSELLDGFNPLTYIPFVKDIWSIAQGYEIERSDMSVVSNLWETIEGMFNEDKSGWEKVSDVTGAISSLFGLPLKNILRDAKAMYNLTETITSGTPTTKAGIEDSIEDAFKNSIPLWGRFTESETKSDKLYEAIISGDQDQINRIKGQFKDEKAIESAMRQGLRENDSRIKEAAQARYEGNISEYTRIAKEIIAEGNFSQDTVVGAINAEISAIKNSESTEDGKVNGKEEDKDEATSIYKASDINDALESGDTSLAKTIINDLVKTKVANGMTEKEAKSSLRSSMTSYWKPLYKQAYSSGNSSEMARIRKILYSSGLYGSADDVVKSTQGWLKD